ncbi:hypothetical protein ZIOFF_046808 [Zingiber officinale]|uniref:Oxysterol-binding protein-related protein 2A n=1 Tax=Zingiber officinale TaxID=94328 RepID=A0A8J5KW59_ZINOF|nr:hypothetical protein ZIOFF_046808 [Zingiber officinale]
MGIAELRHPLCCISIDWPSFGGRSPGPSFQQEDSKGCESPSSYDAVAGVLCKWTNIGKGWRHRWFSLEGGVLTYSKIRRRDPTWVPAGRGVRLIGSAAAAASTGCRKAQKPVRVVRLMVKEGFFAAPRGYLRILGERASRCDPPHGFCSCQNPRKTAGFSIDRVVWIHALVCAIKETSIVKGAPFLQNDVLISTQKLRNHMHDEGLDEALISDCEQIMHSEFAEYHRLLKHQLEDHLNSIHIFHQQIENAISEIKCSNDQKLMKEVDAEDVVSCEGRLHLSKYDLSSSGHEKFIEYSTTESSDDVEKQEFDELSDEDELPFFDTNESFNDSILACSSLVTAENSDITSRIEDNLNDANIMDFDANPEFQNMFLDLRRRTKLPDPIEKEKSVSLWSMIKDNVGKDLTRVCLPVYFNEPLSSLQKCFEDLEYSSLLDEAYEYGKKGNSLLRILKVAAFAVSGYSSCDGRLCKPFNPLLGETYEADYPEKGIRFFSEKLHCHVDVGSALVIHLANVWILIIGGTSSDRDKVSHHPMLVACHCEGKNWKFWGDSNLKNKFWGQSIQLDPVGLLTLEFDDGEIFQWSKVTTTINNLILGKLYCNHHGTMNIRGNRQYSCKLKFKEQSLLDWNPRQVQGYVEDIEGTKVASLVGKWDDSMYYLLGDEIAKTKRFVSTENADLLWKKNKPPPEPTRYNLTSFAITLNELRSELKGKLPPTDSRLRPDQRYLENGEYGKANAEKLRLEKRQRMSRKLQASGWQPRWFKRDSEDGTFCYIGGYWEAREQQKWEDCINIFGEFSNDATAATCIKSELMP